MLQCQKTISGAAWLVWPSLAVGLSWLRRSSPVESNSWPALLPHPLFHWLQLCEGCSVHHEVFLAFLVPLHGVPACLHHVTALHLFPPQHSLSGPRWTKRAPPGEAGAQLCWHATPEQGGALGEELCLPPVCHGVQRHYMV